MKEGWICLERSLLEHWVWSKYPFSYGQAWVDLLLLANHEDKKTDYKGTVITCERGTVNRSIASLADRWHWGREKTSKFLRLLESDEMVVVSATTHRTTVTIVNYDKYQNVPLTKHTTNRVTNRQQTDSKPDINNNINNENNILKDIVEYLNEKTGSNYKASSQATARHINARLNEGFVYQDFVKVIDNMNEAWGKDQEMRQYLRPETLFGSKFEGYLNRKGDVNDKLVETGGYTNTSEFFKY